MRAVAKKLHVLVTDAHNRAGLGACRSLGRAGYAVTAAFPYGFPRPAATWSRYGWDSAGHPDSWQDQLEFRNWMRDQVSTGRFDIVLPTSEGAIFGCQAVRGDFPGECLAILPSDRALQFTLSKFLCTQLAGSLGIPCPQTVFFSEGAKGGRANIEQAGLRFPIVIKTDNYLNEYGNYVKGRHFLVTDMDQAEEILHKLASLPTRILAQEWIPGSGTGACLLRFGGITWLHFAHRRLHEIPYTGGYSSYRESVRDDGLLRLGETILDAIGFEGAAMVEFRGRPGDTSFFLEVNGRLWGSLALALHCGINFPTGLVECYRNGRPTMNGYEYRSGVKCRNIFPGELFYMSSVLKASAARQIEPPPSKWQALAKFFVLSLNPGIRHDYFWWSDPLPGLFQAAGTTKRFCRRFIDRATRRLQRLRTKRLLQELRAEHSSRSKQPAYFHRPLQRILFLCYGNICRSPFAEHYWQRTMHQNSMTGPMATSAGFYPHGGRLTPAWIAELASDYAIDLTQHRSRVVTASQVDSVDAIFVMDRRNYFDLVTRFPGVRDKTYFLGWFAGDGADIEDPYDKNVATARDCLRRLARSLDGLINRIHVVPGGAPGGNVPGPQEAEKR